VQGVALDANPSSGHTLEDPVHVSSTSHSPADARHTAPAFPDGCPQPTPGVQLSTVHGLPSSQLDDVPTHTPV